MFRINKIIILLCVLACISCSNVKRIDSKKDFLNIIKAEQSFSLKLSGGGSLNKAFRGGARPVQICVYVVKGRKWLPPLVKEQSTCVEKSSEPSLAYSSRILLAPFEVKLIDIDVNVNSNDNFWIVLDADFAKPESNYAPYIFKLGQGNFNIQIHIDGNKIL